METYYLIDYENVHTAGLAGCENLTANDHIIIFFTNNAKDLDMRSVANHGGASLSMIEIPAGKQSTDMHIGSYLGYLIGKYDKECRVVIVSKDTDYDKVIAYWKKESGVKIKRDIQVMKEPAPKTASAGASSIISNVSQKVEEAAGAVTEGAKAAGAKAKTSAEQNSTIQKILSKASYPGEVIGHVASTVAKNTGIKNGKQQIYRNLVSKYGQTKGLDIYNHIKKHI